MIVKCCNCSKEYDFDSNVYEVVEVRNKRKFQVAKLLRCPYCSSEHAITFTPVGKFRKKPLKELHRVRKLDLATSYVTLCASRIANATRSWQATCDTNVPNWTKTNEFILTTTVGTSKGPISRTYKLRWRNKTDNPDGAFTDVGVDDILPGIGTDLADGAAVTSGEASECACTQTNWQDGLENEGDKWLPDSGTYELLDEYYTEFHWALKCPNAIDGKEYEFELYDVTEGTAVGIALATITIELISGYKKSVDSAVTIKSAVAHSYGRKLFYANGRWWLFYSDGTNAVYRSSVGGTTWSDKTTVRTADEGYRIYFWHENRGGTDYIHYIYNAEVVDADIYYRRGTLDSDGSISWSNERTAVTAESGDKFYSCGVAPNTDGYPFIIYGKLTDSSYTPWISKSSTNDATWTTDTGFPKQLTTTLKTWSMQIVPLESNRMYSVYCATSTYAKGREWNGTTLLSEEDASSNNLSSNYSFGLATYLNWNRVYLVYLKQTTWDIRFRERLSDGSWGDEEQVSTNSDSQSFPICTSSQSGEKKIHVYWIYNGAIRHRAKGNTGWETEDTPFGTGLTFESTTHDLLNAQLFPDTNSEREWSITWVEDNASPYTLWWGYQKEDKGILQVIKIFTADGQLTSAGETYTKTFIVDSILSGIVTKEITSDVLLEITKSITSLADGILSRQYTKISESDALLKSINTKTLSSDAYLSSTLSKIDIADALVQEKDITKTLTADAILIKIQTKDVATDALLIKQDITKTILSDAHLVEINTKISVSDALLKTTTYKEVTADSQLVNRYVKTINTDALLSGINSKDITIDALLKKVYTSSIITDAILKSIIVKTILSDAYLETVITKIGTTDALIQKLNISKSVTSDAVLKKISTKTILTDARLVELYKYRIFTSDAILKKISTQDYISDALLQAIYTKTSLIDSLLEQIATKEILIDAFLKSITIKTISSDTLLSSLLTKIITTDARLVPSFILKTIISDAIIGLAIIKTFVVDAYVTGIYTKQLITDALLRETIEKIIEADALLKSILIKTTIADVLLSEAIIRTLTSDALLEKTLSKIVITDVLLETVGLKTITTDSILKSIITKLSESDAILSGIITKEITTDAYVGVGYYKYITTDAILWATLSKLILSDALLLEQYIKTNTIDSILKLIETKVIISDSFISGILTKLLLIDGILSKTLTKVNVADSLLEKTYIKSILSDVLLRTSIEKVTLSDGILSILETKTLKTDAILIKTQIKTIVSDAIIGIALVKTFIIDAFLSGIYHKELEADAILEEGFKKILIELSIKQLPKSINQKLHNTAINQKLYNKEMVLTKYIRKVDI